MKDDTIENKIKERFNIPLNEEYEPHLITIKKSNHKIKWIISISTSFIAICLLITLITIFGKEGVINPPKNYYYTTEEANLIIAYKAYSELSTPIDNSMITGKGLNEDDLDNFLITNVRTYYIFTNDSNLAKYASNGRIEIILCNVVTFGKEYETLILTGNGNYNVFGKNEEKYVDNITFSGNSFVESTNDGTNMVIDEESSQEATFTYEDKQIIMVPTNEDLKEVEFTVLKSDSTSITVLSKENYPTKIMMLNPVNVYEGSIIIVSGYLRDGYILASNISIKSLKEVKVTLIYYGFVSYSNFAVIIGENLNGKMNLWIKKSTTIIYDGIEVSFEDFVEIDKTDSIMEIEGVYKNNTELTTLKIYKATDATSFHEVVSNYTINGNELNYEINGKNYSVNIDETVMLDTAGEQVENKNVALEGNKELHLFGYIYEEGLTLLKIVIANEIEYIKITGQVKDIYNNNNFEIVDGGAIIDVSKTYLVNVIENDEESGLIITRIGNVKDIQRRDMVKVEGYYQDVYFMATVITVTKYVPEIIIPVVSFVHLGHLQIINDEVMIKEIGIKYVSPTGWCLSDLYMMNGMMVSVNGNIENDSYIFNSCGILDDVKINGIVNKATSDCLEILDSQNNNIEIKLDLLENILLDGKDFKYEDLTPYSEVTIDGYNHLNKIYVTTLTVTKLAKTTISTYNETYRFVSYDKDHKIVTLDPYPTSDNNKVTFSSEDIILLDELNKEYKLSELDYSYVITLNIEKTEYPYATVYKVLYGIIKEVIKEYTIVDYETYFNNYTPDLLYTLNKNSSMGYTVKDDIMVYDNESNRITIYDIENGDKIIIKLRKYDTELTNEIESIILVAKKATLHDEVTIAASVTEVNENGKVIYLDNGKNQMISTSLVLENIDKIRVGDVLELTYLQQDFFGNIIDSLEKVKRISELGLRKLNLYISNTLYETINVKKDNIYQLPYFDDETGQQINWINRLTSETYSNEIIVNDDYNLTLNYNTIFKFTYGETITINDVTLNMDQLVIPDTILGKPVTNIKFINAYVKDLILGKNVTILENNALSGKSTLEKVTFLTDKTITLGSYCFRKCYKLQTIDFNNQEVIVGESAFTGCTVLNELKCLGISGETYGLFYECRALQTVNFINIISINNGCFYNAICLEEINLPTNIKVIGEKAFYNCQNLKTINLTNITEIQSSAFYNCDSLIEIVLPSLITINDYAFGGCDGLKTFSMGEELNNVGTYILYNASSLETLTVPFLGRSRLYSYHLASYFGMSEFTNSYVVHSNNTFYLPLSLKTVTVTDDDIIHERAFEDARYVTTINYNSINTIESFAFAQSGIKTFFIPKTTIYIDQKAFYKTSVVLTIEEGTDMKLYHKNWNER